MKQKTYLNSFYEGAGGASNPYAHKQITGEFVEKCEDFEIYTSHGGFGVMQFDIVRDGVCVGMCAGINGARKRCAELKGDGWLYWGLYGDYFVWCNYTPRTQKTIWQVTKEKTPPTNNAGYGSLAALLKLKGIA